jgi:hypothetical protein
MDLPLPGLTGTDVAEVRREMLLRGFALLGTPPLFDPALIRTVKKSRITLPAHSKRWWRFPHLARYACWLEEVLADALPEEDVSLTELELRHERAGLVDAQVDGLHADGSYIRSVWTLYGPTTIYRDGGTERSVPDGQTLLMTAQERTRARRVRCTLHRRPGAGAERAVIVCSFEPNCEPSRMPNVHRQVAQER